MIYNPAYIYKFQLKTTIAAIVPKVSSKKYGEWLQCPKESCEFETTQNDILDEHLRSKIFWSILIFMYRGLIYVPLLAPCK